MLLQKPHDPMCLPPGQATYKPEEASSLLGVGRGGVYGLIRSGRLRSIRIGRKIIIPASALQEFLDQTEGPK